MLTGGNINAISRTSTSNRTNTRRAGVTICVDDDRIDAIGDVARDALLLLDCDDDVAATAVAGTTRLRTRRAMPCAARRNAACI